MTINEAIQAVDSLKPNGYSELEKIGWLSELDGTIKAEIIDTHEGADKEEAINEYIKNNAIEYENAINEYMKINEVSYEEAKANIPPYQEVKYKDAKEYVEKNRMDIMFNGYNETTPLDTELIVKAPYDRIYKSWLESRIDYANGDYARYNNSVTVFNTDYLSFQRAYNRKNMPKGSKIKFF